jgi:hypothetical protein
MTFAGASSLKRLLKRTLCLFCFCAFSFYAGAQGPFFSWVKGFQAYFTHPVIGSYSYGYAIRTDISGNVFVAGTFARTVDFNPADGVDSQSTNVYLGGYFAKYDSMGNHIWAKTMPGAEVNSMCLDDSGYIYVAGKYYDVVDFDPGPGVRSLPGYGNGDFYVAKYTRDGILKWVRGSGGTQVDAANGVAVDNQGNVYVTGVMHGQGINFNERNPGSVLYNTLVADGFVAKYDRDGNYLWSRHIKGADGDVGYDIALDATANVYICGYSNGAMFDGTSASFVPGRFVGVSTHDAFIAKYTSTGTYVWAKTVGSDKEDMGHSLAIDKNGNILLAGYFSGTIDFDPSNPGAQITTNNYYGAAFVAKFTNNGAYSWAKGYGGRSGYNKAFAVAVDDSSHVYVAGQFSDTVNFNPGGTNGSHAAHYHSGDFIRNVDMFLVKLKADGAYAWSKAYGNVQRDEIKDVYLDKNYNLFFTGMLSRSTTFEPVTNGSVIINTPAGYEAPVATFCKYAQVKQGTSSITAIGSRNLSLRVYPNPAGNQIMIDGFEPGSHIIPFVTDIAGRDYALSYNQGSRQLTLHTGSLSPGIYFVRCTDEKGRTATLKFLKTE